MSEACEAQEKEIKVTQKNLFAVLAGAVAVMFLITVFYFIIVNENYNTKVSRISDALYRACPDYVKSGDDTEAIMNVIRADLAMYNSGKIDMDDFCNSVFNAQRNNAMKVLSEEIK